jgi:spermidine synthase
MAHRRGQAIDVRVLLACLGCVCLAETWVVALSPKLLSAAVGAFGPYGGEVALSVMVFLIPTMLMGAVFAEVIQSARRPEGGVGRAVALNTVGAAAAGPLFFGILLPGSGLKWALALVAVGYVALMPRPWRGWPVALTGVAVLLALVSPRRLQLIDVPPGARVTRYLEGRLATVSVVRTADGHRVLRVNNHFQQGGTATAGAARRHAHLPLLVHGSPRRALFLGVGTGITMGAALAHPNLEAEGVELLPGVAAVLQEFQPENAWPAWGNRLRLSVADARRHVRCTTDQFDVIVADLFHPSEDGAGFLYTRDHFAALRGRLAPGGIVCQWLGLHQLDQATFAGIVRTFLEVFPNTTLWLLRANVDLPVAGLIGGDALLQCDPETLSDRLKDPVLSEALGSVGMNSPVRILGWLLAGPQDLRRWARAGFIATDDLPHVLFQAPAAVYDPQEGAAARLETILQGASPAFQEILPDSVEGEWLTRLEAFRLARDYHLNGLIKNAAGRHREAIDEYVRSAAASPDYTAGYAQAILVASAYIRERPEFARQLLRKLMEARPELGLANEMLERVEKRPNG